MKQEFLLLRIGALCGAILFSPAHLNAQSISAYAEGDRPFPTAWLRLETTNYLQASSDVSAGWQTVATIVPATNTFTFVDTTATNHQQQFYRVIGPP